jgi:hypothetical protein
MMCQGKIKNSKESDAPTRPVVNVIHPNYKGAKSLIKSQELGLE